MNAYPFAKSLKKLAEDNKPPGESGKIVSFLNAIDCLLAEDDEQRDAVRTALGRYNRSVRALSIRQPHAEAIMRGVKKIEYRSGPTKIRRRILIYASLGRYLPAANQR